MWLAPGDSVSRRNQRKFFRAQLGRVHRTRCSSVLFLEQHTSRAAEESRAEEAAESGSSAADWNEINKMCDGWHTAAMTRLRHVHNIDM